MKPCDEACPKCGSSDIHRRHRMLGDDDHAVCGPSGKRRSSVFINRSDPYYHPVVDECIAHHCRSCQYYWDTHPMTTEQQPQHPGNEDHLNACPDCGAVCCDGSCGPNTPDEKTVTPARDTP